MRLNIDDSAVKRIDTLRGEKNSAGLMLRLRVEGGGCSGFQYKMELTADKTPQDIVFADAVITDDISLPYLDGATVSFDDGLIGSEFKITNPNAVSGCGCGVSFSVV